MFSCCDGSVETGGTDLRLPPAPRQTPPPALSGAEGGNGLHRGWSRNKISPHQAFVCFLYVVLFFKTCEGITYQKDVVFCFFFLNHHPLVVAVRHHPCLVFCLVCQESSKIHPNASATGANDAAQTWDLLLPLGGQCRPGS